MRKLLPFFLLIAALPTYASTYYVRSDGGSRYSASQPTGVANGTADAACVGTTPNQNCAWNDIRYAWATGSYTPTVSCPDYCWALTTGDILMVRDCIQYSAPGVPISGSSGPCRIGYSGPNSGDYFLAVAGDPGSSGAPPPPNNVKIRGYNYLSCNTKAVIRVGYGAGSGFETRGSDGVEYDCLDVSDQAECGRAGIAFGCNTGYPLDDYGNNGFNFYGTTTHLTLKDISVHGMANDCFHGPTGDGALFANIDLAGCPDSTWNADPGDGTTGTGSLYMNYFTMTAAGFIEEYPIMDAMPYIHGFDQSSGGYGDCFGTTTAASSPGWNVWFDHGTIRYCTQDGPDALHINGGTSSVKITNTVSYGSMGQQAKIGGSPPTLYNDFFYSNANALRFPVTGFPAAINISSYAITGFGTGSNQVCFVTSTQSLTSGTNIALSGFGTATFFNGQALLAVSATGLTSTSFCVPFTHANASATEAGITTAWNGYLSNFGRGGDEAIAVTLSDNYTSIFQFVTLITANATGWFFTCADTCTHPVVKYQNNIMLGYTNDASHGYISGAGSGNLPERITYDASIVQGPNIFTNSGSAFDHNDTFHEKVSCPNPNETNSLCVDPLLTNEAWQQFGFANSVPASLASPPVGAGIAIGGITTDLAGTTRPNPPTEGAYEPAAAPPPPTGTKVQFNRVIINGIKVTP